MEQGIKSLAALVVGILLGASSPAIHRLSRSSEGEELDHVEPPRPTKRWRVGEVVGAVFGLLGAGLGAYATLRTEPFIKEQAEVARAAENRAIITEARQIWIDFLSRFDSNDTWMARTTLIRYCNDLVGIQAEPSKLTAEYLAYYVYHTSKVQPHNEELALRIPPDKHEYFFGELDKSRRLIKNFHETMKVLAENKRISETLRKELLDTRFYNAAEFLEIYWLPVEKAQNRASHRDNGTYRDDADQRADGLVAWYRENSSRTRPSRRC